MCVAASDALGIVRLQRTSRELTDDVLGGEWQALMLSIPHALGQFLKKRNMKF